MTQNITQKFVAIIADYKEFAPYMWHATPSPYINAAIEVGGFLPIIIPAIGEKLDIENLLAKIDGVMLSGAASNVHPSLYGANETADHLPFDKARDATTLPLIRAAIKRGVPLLAICRGIQELNVALGGTLTAAFQKVRQNDHKVDDKNEPLDKRFEIAHDIEITANCNLAEIIGDNSAKVNSLHGQAIDKIGNNITIEAKAIDGTIEAISVADSPGFVMGVQWHPEYWAKTDSASNKIIKAFGKAVQKYGDAKN